MSRAQQIRKTLSEGPATVLELCEDFGQPYKRIRASIEVLMRQGHLEATGQQLKTKKGQLCKTYQLTARGRKLAQLTTQ